MNAIDAVEGNGHVTVSTWHGSGEVVAQVRDDGCGMTADVLDRIFDPFFTTKRRGTGLGLAMVQRIVSDHGGSVSVESQPGEGARFTVTLPLP